MATLTPFESSLIGALVNKYQDKGINVQKVLDNPLFMMMPLEAKIEAINQYASQLGQNPGFHFNQFKQLGKSTVAGAGAMAATSLLAEVTRGIAPSAHGMGLAAVIGGGIGLAAGAYKVGKEYSRDKDTAKDIRESSSLEALVNRTFKPTGTIPESKAIQAVEAGTNRLFGAGVLQQIFNG